MKISGIFRVHDRKGSIAKITSALTIRLPAHIRLLQAHIISNESDPPRIVSFYDSTNHKKCRIKILGFFSSLWRESERYVVFSSQEWKKKKGNSILGALRASNWLFMVVGHLHTFPPLVTELPLHDNKNKINSSSPLFSERSVFNGARGSQLTETSLSGSPSNHIVKDVRNCETRGVHVDAISNISSVLKTREVTEYVVSPRDVSVSDPFQMYHAARSLEKTDFMRQLIEMKQNGFLSSPLGGAPVEVPVSKYFF
ncbi:hypothetical protein YC2023_118444 [Brassica napus]